MIELKDDQSQPVLDKEKQPVAVIDPRSGVFLSLIRRGDVREDAGILRPFNRGWDDPELDVYEQYRKKQ